MPVPGAAILFPDELTFMVGTGLLRCRSEFATEPPRCLPPPLPFVKPARSALTLARLPESLDRRSAAGGHRTAPSSRLPIRHPTREERTPMFENHPHIMCSVFIALARATVYLTIYYGIWS
jgi:hypothetical protein